MRILEAHQERVTEIAFAVRSAIEACTPDELPWRAFPKGACGDTCLILGQVLHDEGFQGAEYICGNKYRSDGKPYSHAWLRYEGLIIDITADQFPDVEEKVIVSSESKWHKQWDEELPESGVLQDYVASTVQPLWKFYSLLKLQLHF
jgi:hypothetical protein